MTRRQMIGYGLLAVFVSTFIVAWTYPRFKLIEKRSHSTESIATVQPVSVEQTSEVVNRLFNQWADFNQVNRSETFHNKFPANSPWSKFFLFQKMEGPASLFPLDEELLRDHGVDASIERYVRIPSDRRRHDVYLYEPTGDLYWDSEYTYNGQPAKFRCSFIIHMEPVDEASSKLEIFEFQPTIWVGRYLGLSAHSVLPAMLSDIRPVEATFADRKTILSMIESAR